MNDVKNLILDKAKERAERFGFKKTTMDEISKDCRISKKTIYEYFEDKEDMFSSLVLREGHYLIQTLLAQIEDVSDPVERISQLIRNSTTYFSQDHFIPKIYKEDDIVLALTNRKYQDIIDEEVITVISEIIRDGKRQGMFRNVDEKIIAYAGQRLFQAFTHSRTGPLRNEQNNQDYTEILIDFFLNGIVKK